MKRLLMLVALGAVLHADDIILKSGEVIEGKVDRAATDAANKGKTNPNDTVLIVTDEKGSQRAIKHSDVKYIVPKKPSWEVRRDNLAWYDKNKDRVKDTVAGWESFARQCRSKKLDEQADEAYGRAYELKKKDMAAKGKTSPDDHLALAKWCHKVGYLDGEREQNQIALKEKRKEIEKETDTGKRVKALLDLASAFRRNGLEEESLGLYEDVLKEDPANATAKGAIDELRESMGLKMKELVKEWEKSGRAWKIRVAIEDDASAQVMERWKGLLERLSTFIFEATEGQFFVSEWILEDQTSNGKIIVDKGKLEWASMQGPPAQGVLAYCGGPGQPNWFVRCPGKTWESVLCHEMFHGVFGLLDEYYQNPMCPCIMRAAPNPQKICSPSTHVGGGHQREPCWDTIKKRYVDVVSPNPAWVYTKQGIRGVGGAEEVDGELTLGGNKLVKPPACAVIVIDH